MWRLTATFLAALATLSTLGHAAHVSARADTVPGQLRLVENSGECETVPGVYQASGYADIDANNSMWYVYATLVLVIV